MRAHPSLGQRIGLRSAGVPDSSPAGRVRSSHSRQRRLRSSSRTNRRARRRAAGVSGQGKQRARSCQPDVVEALPERAPAQSATALPWPILTAGVNAQPPARTADIRSRGKEPSSLVPSRPWNRPAVRSDRLLGTTRDSANSGVSRCEWLGRRCGRVVSGIRAAEHLTAAPSKAHLSTRIQYRQLVRSAPAGAVSRIRCSRLLNQYDWS